MNNKVISTLMFVLGASAGVGGTYIYFKKKYEQLAQKEIDSVKEYYKNRNSSVKPKSEKEDGQAKKAEMAKEKPSVVEYATFISKHKYDEVLNRVVEDDDEEEEESDEENFGSAYDEDDYKGTLTTPYVIPPEQFGEMPGYDTISLTYYADEVLTDDEDVLVNDIDNTVGEESLTHFGEYEDDSVFVRNNRMKCDFEILKDLRTYTEVCGINTRQEED